MAKESQSSLFTKVVTDGSKIRMLSPVQQVSMADEWYAHTSSDHFWFRRRFDVLARLAGKYIRKDLRICEIGCGAGVLQEQIHGCYGTVVDGFDLNFYALERNASKSPLYHYDISERHKEFENIYDTCILFDTLEHIPDDKTFLSHVGHHIKPQGFLIVNVPAFQFFYSKYDEAAGHVRRYSYEDLTTVCDSAGFKPVSATYWGAPLIPLLILRRFLLQFTPKDKVIETGFSRRNSLVNYLLSLFSRAELIPQRWLGTSVMVVFQKAQV